MDVEGGLGGGDGDVRGNTLKTSPGHDTESKEGVGDDSMQVHSPLEEDDAFSTQMSVAPEESSEENQKGTERFEKGTLVRVLQKTIKGVPDQRYGVAKVVGPGITPGHYKVKFTLGGFGRDVPPELMVPYDMFGTDALIQAAKEESLKKDKKLLGNKRAREDSLEQGQGQAKQKPHRVAPAQPMDNEWVRRSLRCTGKQQLVGSRVQHLMKRLHENDPQLKIVRVKNELDANTNKLVLLEMLDALETNTVVEVLYMQNLEEGMDDEVLQRLTDVLKGSKIWALNVGENFGVSRQGWEKFAEDLKSTNITHMYAGSETTVCGKLKVKMRNVIRENRVKHKLHNSVENMDVIRRIGQMWWNPRNSKLLQSHLTTEERSAIEQKEAPLLERRVCVCVDGDFRVGRVKKYNEAGQLHWIEWESVPGEEGGRKEGASGAPKQGWVRLDDTKYLVSGAIMWGVLPVAANALSSDHSKPKTHTHADPLKLLTKACREVLASLKTLPATKFFSAPFAWKKHGCYDYLEVVKSPLDLRKVKQRVEAKAYPTLDAFKSDVVKVFQDWILYFSDREGVSNDLKLACRWAAELEDYFHNEVQAVANKYQIIDVLPLSNIGPTDAAKNHVTNQRKPTESEQFKVGDTILAKKPLSRKESNSDDEVENQGEDFFHWGTITKIDVAEQLVAVVFDQNTTPQRLALTDLVLPPKHISKYTPLQVFKHSKCMVDERNIEAKGEVMCLSFATNEWYWCHQSSLIPHHNAKALPNASRFKFCFPSQLLESVDREAAIFEDLKT
mmetsp:Transcript_13196/g.23435  ORF Transcript_13196/g.23435 Transcript_13196/m.23435 type:complete len:784 (+) Transcript_13196:141-2492(+)